MNDHQKRRFASKIVSTLFNTVSGKKIAFLGWAFKKDTNDTRESAAIYVADQLIDEQAKVCVFDPKVKTQKMYDDINYLDSRTDQLNKQHLQIVSDPYEACKDAHAIAILTEWDEFATYDWQRIYDQMKKPAFVFDGRRLLERAQLENIGFNIYTVGHA